MIDTAHTALPNAAPGTRRPSWSPALVMTRGLLASGVAVMAGLAITYLVRVMVNVNAFENSDSINSGFPNTGALSAGVCIATLLAVGVLYLLGRVSPRPFAAFAVIMGLSYLAFLGVSVTSGLTASQISGQLLVCLPLAVVIAGLASWATGIHPDTR
ncbi:hypothetical protein GXW83_22335 [Streptacidiphilus sp. PB12-B1b]|uniref:hypothetical protein n=1 Tax=Streptacidiphilus sp. PB12-B1b TaxID=2705012 RepID=UPI0015FB2836|nr:hypothetical protein [Streptacidiphilus sp. PB12-B1b]QMU78028.1 hypothetical protein GXW83_22335 [Streptacidiphilus sp. PB12-B1b]